MSEDDSKAEVESAGRVEEDLESSASTVDLDPAAQVLITELSVSVEEAQRLLKEFGSVSGVMRKRILEEIRRRMNDRSGDACFLLKLKFIPD